MRTKASRRSHALTMAVLTAAVCLSGRVEAQQSGLFPLAPIRRQRVPCANEDPIYKIYKERYFGYHPTCWQTFPEGWGAPSKQAPNLAESLKNTPLGTIPAGDEGGLLPEERGALPPAGRAAPLPRRPAEPTIPDADDVFEQQPGTPTPPLNPLPRGNARPRTNPAPRQEMPFDEFTKPGASLSPSRGRTPPRGVATDGAPELTAPSGTPAQGSASRSARDDGDGVLPASGDEEPLLGLADAEVARTDDPGSTSDPQPGADTAPAASSSPGIGTTTPATPARPRRRLFGNLFSSLGANWNRQ